LPGNKFSDAIKKLSQKCLDQRSYKKTFN